MPVSKPGGLSHSPDKGRKRERMATIELSLRYRSGRNRAHTSSAIS